MALLAMIAMTGCTNEDIWDSSAEEAARREYYYNAKFESMFGKIDPNQDWGFGLNGLSRSVDVDGNMWVSPPQVTEAEIIVVWCYLLQQPNLDKSIPNFTRYYLTQVFGSNETYQTTYTINNETKTYNVVGSKQMNHLHVAASAEANINDLTYISQDEEGNYVAPTGWEHSNNFNASSNANYGGNTVHYDSGTYNFIYANSTDTSIHDNYVVASGADIITWANSVNWSSIISTITNSKYASLYVNWTEYDSENNTTENPNETLATALSKFNWSTVSNTIKEEIGGNYYICFDYESIPEMTTHFSISATVTYTITLLDEEGNPIKDEETGENKTVTYTDNINGSDISVSGFYNSLSEVDSDILEDIIIAKSKDAVKYQKQYDTNGKEMLDDYSNATITYSLTSADTTTPTQVEELDKLFYGDQIYTDWVVRLRGGAKTLAEAEAEANMKRVIVEDLSVAASNNLSNVSESDWDFNDVVMDILITPGETAGSDKAKIKIQALGGTLPIYLGAKDSRGNVTLSQELHTLMGAPSYGLMINTGTGNNLTAVETELTGVFTTDGVADYNNVLVFVDKDKKQTGNASDYTELKAEKGKAPCKICVGTDFYWCRERVLITRPYSNFSDWVSGRSETESPDNVSVTEEGETTTYKWYYSDIEKATDTNDDNYFNSLVFGNGN